MLVVLCTYCVSRFQCTGCHPNQQHWSSAANYTEIHCDA